MATNVAGPGGAVESKGLKTGALGLASTVVIGVASTGAEAVRRAEELKPDVTLVDIDLGEESGFDVARALTERRVPPQQSDRSWPND